MLCLVMVMVMCVMCSLLQIGEVWRAHVASIGRDKSGVQAVHTHFLFGRLLSVLRQQFSVLTREACNYLGRSYNAIASHFLVTVELLSSQLQLPCVYVDSELVSGSVSMKPCLLDVVTVCRASCAVGADTAD